MSPSDAFVIASGVFLIASAVFLAIAAWTAPQLLEGRFMRWASTGKRLAPTRGNRTLMSAWALLFGIYLLLSVTSYAQFRHIALIAWAPVGIVVFKRTFWPRSEA